MNTHLAEISEDLNIQPENSNAAFDALSEGESRWIRDLKVNLKNAIKPGQLSEKEVALIGLAIASNERAEVFERFFIQKAYDAEANAEEIGEAVACASLLASNNVLYRFRHFTDKEKYNTIPAGIKMNIMMKPATGKAFFELMSLAVSAVNGCEMCVKSHEQSLIELGVTEEKIFASVKLAAIIVSATKVIR
ncbi:carboxymuconolactone decarboxylase family protein [Fulvivirga maritima]|uniref:carboxymuconolactone decarboxylase family protein n=1 Tax=Fulvivirga maritima TaxID=2904247 RepID=UPI001F2859EE|nr:carboxymuconolactone decarboxylase family protein [Fulvivirga maritima]UII28779.1 carboxymuconolactone decarboxylase family protein [Fulvivirga maritima]